MDTLKWRGLITFLTQVLMLRNAVIGKECKDAVSVGSLKQDNINHNAIVTEGQTFILAGYVIPCSGTVVAWEFCHRTSSVPSATFYPGIWSNASDLSTDYRLIQSTNVTFDTTGNDIINKCQKFKVSIKDQFIAPVGSFVGLYSNINAQLLHTNISGSITTYQFNGNQSSGSYDDVHYNIAITVHLDAMTTSSSALPMIWIITGGIVGLLVSTLLLVSLISLCWHRRKRSKRSQYQTLHGQTLHDHGTAQCIGSDGYSANTITPHHDVTAHGYNCINHSSSVNKVTAPYPCLEPSTPASEAVPMLSPHRELKHIPDYNATVGLADYPSEDLEEDVTAAFYKSSTGSGISNEKLHQDDQIYEDPGCHKETLYSWFEKRKIRKIRIRDIRMEQKIGAGEFGVVTLGVWANGSAEPVQVAVKTLNSQCSESDRVKFLREAAIMGQFTHNNVVQLHGVVSEEDNMMIVLEYMPKGDLLGNLLHIKSTISQETCYQVSCNLLSFCRQIAAGLNYLASKQFVHRDLAARNILVSSDNVCKIADFGMARDVGDNSCYVSKGGKIPLKWTAPEAIIHNKYSTQSDVWSFGCVLYEIWSLGHAPFEDVDGRECVEKLTIGYRLPPPPGCPRAIYELMMKCWHPDSQHRPLPEAIHQTLKRDDTSLLTSSTDVVVNGEDDPVILGNPLGAGSQLYSSLQQMYRVIL